MEEDTATQEILTRVIVADPHNPDESAILIAGLCPSNCSHCKILPLVIERSDGKKELWKLSGRQFDRGDDGHWRIGGTASTVLQYFDKTYLRSHSYLAEIDYDPASGTGSVLSCEKIEIDFARVVASQ